MLKKFILIPELKGMGSRRTTTISKTLLIFQDVGREVLSLKEKKCAVGNLVTFKN